MLGGERLATSLAHAQQLLQHATADTPAPDKKRRSRT
jgi:hypothetical protein